MLRWPGSMLLLTLGFVLACTPTTGTPAAKPSTNPTAGAAAANPATNAGSAAPAADSLQLTQAEESEVASFYRGKTVRILVGFAAGAGYDLFARTTGRHLSRFLPGSPTIIVENMPGANSLVLANHLYHVAPKDGTVFGTFDASLVLTQAVGGGQDAIQFDPANVSWLGSPTVSTNICLVRADTGIDSVEKLVASPREIVFGATGLGGATSVQPALMQHYLNAKLRILTGYDGVAKIKLAVEGNEVDGTCGTWESFKSSHAEWMSASPPFAYLISKGKADALGDLTNVPLLSNALPQGEAQQMLALAMAPQAAGFIYAAPPNISASRLKALRGALLQTWNDPEYQADATRAGLVPIAQDYRTIERLIAEIVDAPPDLKQRAKQVLSIQ